jgi:hypothetical protein
MMWFSPEDIQIGTVRTQTDSSSSRCLNLMKQDQRALLKILEYRQLCIDKDDSIGPKWVLAH